MATINGTENGETIDGTSSNDTIYGLGGDDTINGLGGDDTLWGGEDDDSVDGGIGSDKLYGEAGDDTLTTSVGADTLHGGAGTDTLVVDYGSATASVINNGAPAADGINGGFQGGYYSYTDASQVTYYGIERFVITTGSGTDTITTATGDDVVSTGGGNDVVNVGSGIDEAHGGEGEDGISANMGAAAVAILWNLQTDSYSGQGSFTGFEYLGTLVTGSGNDVIVTTALHRNETITTGVGDDTVTVAGGSDVVNAGGGVDTLIIDLGGATGAVINNGAITADGINGGFQGGYYDYTVGSAISFSGMERFVITSGSGADSLITTSGDDVISTGGGNDIVDVGTGTDQADGGEGIDRISANMATAGVAILWDLQANTYVGHGSFSNFEYFGSLVTGSGADVVVTAALNRNDTVSTGAGDDVIIVAGGSDVVNAGTGFDTLIVDLRAATGNVANNPAPSADGTNGGFQGGYHDHGSGNNISFSGVDRFEIATGSGNDTITTGGGNDTLDGGAGNDTLNGGGGDDTITVTGGTDSVAGGTGSDRLVLDARTHGGAVSLSALTLGADGYSGSASWNGTSVTFSGIEHFTIVTSGNVSDTITTGGGDDVFVHAAHNSLTYLMDTVVLGMGMDTIVADLSGVDVGGLTIIHRGTDATGESGYIGLGPDVYGKLDFTGANHFEITGTQVADTIVTFGGNDILSGGLGNDMIDGGDGNDDMDGGSGTDTVSYARAGAGVTVDLRVTTVQDTFGAGIDRLANLENITGSAHADALTGDGAANHMKGDGGDDLLAGGAGDDTLEGGEGDDRLVYSGEGNDPLHGGAGVDTLVAEWGAATAAVVDNPNAASFGFEAGFWDQGANSVGFTGIERIEITTGAFADNVTLSSGSDIASLGDGNDTVRGAAGDDLLAGGGGADSLDGGDGIDTASYRAAGAAVQIGLLSGSHSGDAAGDTFVSIERFELSAHADTFSGANGDDHVSGLGGDDHLDGGAGNDTLIGNDGNDWLVGNGGTDTMVGGAGNDTFLVDSVDEIVTEAAGEGVDEIRTGLANVYSIASLVNVENLFGYLSYNYTLTGNALNNEIRGNGGTDTLDGGEGDDTLRGDASSDVLIGGAGTDRLFGGLGHDTLDGGTGDDLLEGESGDDVYIVDSLGDDVNEYVLGGIDEIRTGLAAYSLAALGQVENLTGTAATGQTLTGNGLANVITGGDGNDVIDGNGGSDTLAGGAGDDLYTVDSSDDIVTEAAAGGTDLVQSSATFALGAEIENLTLTGAAAIDGTGNALANTILGNAADNRIDGGAGADDMRGGLGNDTYVIDDAADAVVEAEGEGTDTIEVGATYTLGATFENLTLTGTGAIDGTGNASANVIAGNSGANRLDGGAGDDTLIGGEGDDTYVVDSAGDAVVETAAAGTDTVETALAAYTLAAEVENLTGTSASGQSLTGNDLANRITGGAAHDVLDGGAGADTMAGGAGEDIYIVDSADDVVIENGGEGNSDGVRTALAAYTLTAANVETLSGTRTDAGQQLTGSSGDNIVRGTELGDVLDGAGGSDQLLGYGGDDTLRITGGSGSSDTSSEVASGGAGNDLLVIDYGAMTDQVGLYVRSDGESGADGFVDVPDGTPKINFSGIERLSVTTGSGNDILTGVLGADLLNGGSGNDLLLGRGGNDTLNAEDGDDTLDGGDGDDTLDGGAGSDTATYGSALAGVQVSLAVTAAQNTGGAGTDTLAGIENLTGSAHDDVLTGDGGANLIRGAAGNDTLDGGAGADRMEGGMGNDVYVVDDAADLVVELAGEGDADEVRTGLSGYVLPDDVEILTILGGSGGATDVRGNAGDNTIEGSASNDFVRLQDGGEDSAEGQDGGDVFYMGGALSAGDTLDGGTGSDQVALQGDYSAGLTLGAGNLTGSEVLALLSGADERFGDVAGAVYDYRLTSVDANVAAGTRLTIDAAQLGEGEDFTFDGSAETDGSFYVFAGRGTDSFIGGGQLDVFLFRSDGRFTGADRVDGGGGSDQLALRGVYTGADAVTMQAGTMVNVEVLAILSGHNEYYGPVGGDFSYDITMHDGNVAAGALLCVDAAQLRATETLTFNGAAELDGSFKIWGGLGGDTITGGAQGDIITGGGGGDALAGGAGDDTFRYRAVSDSLDGAEDRILDFTAGDLVDLSAIDADTGTTGDQGFTFIGSDAFSGVAGQLRAEAAGGNDWLIQGDVDGDGAMDFEILVTTGDADPITSVDFVF